MTIQQEISKLAISQLDSGAYKYRKWFYGSGMGGVAWCAVFVSWLANQCNQLEVCIPKTDGAGCFAREGVPKGWGMWIEAKRYEKPKVGDIITFRDWGESTYSDRYHADHVGIIVDVNSKIDNTFNITTIEGNTDGDNDTSTVNRRTYNTINGYVYAYYRPNYNQNKILGGNVMECKKGDINVFVLSVKALLQQAQRLGIIKAGCDDKQGFGSGTENAVLEFQKLKGLTVDGIVGAKTVEALREAIEKQIEQIKKNNSVTKNTTVAELAKIVGA